MLEYIAPVLIFVSLGVIIYIVGKHLPELKKFDEAKDKKNEGEEDTKKAKVAICKGGRLCRNGIIFVIEAMVKKMKQLMHLIHFWILKIKKGGDDGDEASREIEVKQELIESEEQNLDKILNEDLADENNREEKDELDYSKEEEIEKKQESKFTQKENEIESDSTDAMASEEPEDVSEDNLESKIGSFFSPDKEQEDWSREKDEEELSKGFSFKAFVSNFFLKFSRKNKKENETEDDPGEEREDQFSDGIVDVKEVEAREEGAGKNLIKEVVPASNNGKKKEDVDIDEEIGVDRSILEKKIVQKIANNPKDIENYRELGDLYVKMKNFTDAEECYKQVLRIHVRDADAKRKIEKVRLLKRMG